MNYDGQSLRVKSLKKALHSIHPLALQNPEVIGYHQTMFTLIEEAADFALMRNRPHAHFTVSAFIFTPHGDCLALFHKKLQRWLQPGGHLELEDLTPIEGALREAKEESALEDLQPLSPHPIDLDIHLIPARVNEEAHEHYDLRFAFMTHRPQTARISEESHGLQWLKGEPLADWGQSSPSIGRPLHIASVLLNTLI